jgi:hypothetical protein
VGIVLNFHLAFAELQHLLEEALLITHGDMHDAGCRMKGVGVRYQILGDRAGCAGYDEGILICGQTENKLLRATTEVLSVKKVHRSLQQRN